MIQNSTTDGRKFEGNLEGETIQVGIHDMRLIIDRLTDMYSDREMASIREYSCNAYDAHIEAGVNAPIEVTTPSALSPVLTIRDYGVGLSLEDIREIYSQYGASTKRNTNTQIGAFGLGCKSGLAYCDQFTVTSIKDGVRIQVVVSRDPVAGITMKVVDTSDTSEANGTIVAIPAKAYNTFEQKAKQFFTYWKPGTVKLNGSEPKFMAGAQRVTDDLYLRDDSSQSYIVMGGVPYPADLSHGLGWNKSIVAFVGIGDATPAPQRESLIDDDTTVATMRRVERQFKEALQQSIVDDIAASSSSAEAATKRIAWSRKVPHNYMPTKITFKGKDVPDSYTTEFDVIHANTYASKMSAHSTYRLNQHIPIPSVNGSLWITDFDYVSFTATVRKKIEKWLEDNNMERPTGYFLVPGKGKRPDQTWLDGLTFVDWQVIKAIKLPRNTVNPRTGRIPGSYDLYYADEGYQRGVPGSDIDEDNAVFWTMDKYRASNMHQALLKSYPDCTLVVLRSGREGKFQRLFPDAKEAEKVTEGLYNEWVANIDKDDARAYLMRQNADHRLRHLDENLLDDPEIAAVKRVMDRDTTDLQAEIRFWNGVGHYWSPEDDSKIENPLDKYVLLPETYYFDRYMKRHGEAMYRYMNCEYAHLSAQDDES